MFSETMRRVKKVDGILDSPTNGAHCRIYGVVIALGVYQTGLKKSSGLQVKNLL